MKQSYSANWVMRSGNVHGKPCFLCPECGEVIKFDKLIISADLRRDSIPDYVLNNSVCYNSDEEATGDYNIGTEVEFGTSCALQAIVGDMLTVYCPVCKVIGDPSEYGPWYKQTMVPIDEGVADACSLFIKAGYKTISSCMGHVKLDSHGWLCESDVYPMIGFEDLTEEQRETLKKYSAKAENSNVVIDDWTNWELRTASNGVCKSTTVEPTRRVNTFLTFGPKGWDPFDGPLGAEGVAEANTYISDCCKDLWKLAYDCYYKKQSS